MIYASFGFSKLITSYQDTLWMSFLKFSKALSEKVLITFLLEQTSALPSIIIKLGKWSDNPKNISTI